MTLPLILAGLGVAGQVAGGVQANQQRQNAKGVIDQTYRLGRQRLGVRQQDVRRTQAEGIVARGLAGGGARIRTAPIAPEGEGGRAPLRSGIRMGNAPAVAGVPALPVTGARTLGQQQQVDMAREQQLEQNALLEQRNAARAGVEAGYAQSLAGTIGGAVASGIQGYQTGQAFNAFRGIDPIDPLRRGAWAQPQVDALNIYSQRG